MIKLCKVAKSYRRLYGGSGGGGQDCTLTLSNICKVLRRCRSDFEMLRLLVFNKSLSNLAMLIILRPSFQWCLQIFPNLSTSKIKKNHAKVYLKTRQGLLKLNGILRKFAIDNKTLLCIKISHSPFFQFAISYYSKYHFLYQIIEQIRLLPKLSEHLLVGLRKQPPTGDAITGFGGVASTYD